MKKPIKPKGKTVVLAAHHDLSLFSAKGDCAQSYAHYDAGKDILEATNGRVLVQVPVIVEEGETTPIDCLIEHRIIQRMCKRDATAQLVTEANRVKLTAHNSTDMGVAESHETIDARFPRTSSISDMATGKIVVTLNAEVLKKIALYALKYSKDDAVVFTFGQEMTRFEIALKGDVKATGFFVTMGMKGEE